MDLMALGIHDSMVLTVREFHGSRVQAHCVRDLRLLALIPYTT
ncbi:hypothetical protein [Actinacidiphila soli]|nr:hypothetical protein [Actinacidiphila soli]